MPIESSLVYDPEKKQFGIIPDYDTYVPYWLTTDHPNQVVTVAALTVSPAFVLSYRPQGPFRGHYLWYDTPVTAAPAVPNPHNNVLTRMEDGRDGYQYMQGGRRVHLDTIGSPAPGFPAILSEALVLQHGANVNISFQNLSGANATNVRWGIEGFGFEPSRITTDEMRDKVKGTLERLHYMRPHFMTNDDGVCTIPQAAQRQFTWTLDDAGYFEVFKIAAVGYRGAVADNNLITAAQAQNVLLSWIDNKKMQWSNGLVQDLPFTWFNTPGRTPLVLPVRYMMAPKDQLILNVNNTNAATAVSLYITLIGRRIFAPRVD